MMHDMMNTRWPVINGHPFEVVAHRGVRTLADTSRIAPENTQPACEEAARLGASVEIDVLAPQDRNLVVHHDNKTGKIFRLQNGDKLVRKATLIEMQSAKLNQTEHETETHRLLGTTSSYHTPPHYYSVAVPTLNEVVEKLPDTRLYVELKTSDREVLLGLNNQLEARASKLIQDRKLHERVSVISFSPLSLRKIKQLDPNIKTGLDFVLPKPLRNNTLFLKLFINRFAKNWLGVESLHPSYESTTPELVERAHQAGLRVLPWVNRQTRDEEAVWFPKLIEMGVDGLITNAVDLLQQAVNQPQSKLPTG